MSNNGPLITVVLCTRNRARELRQTLGSFAGLCLPQRLPTELLVVDNASTDDTPGIVQSFSLPGVSVRYLYEARRGKGYAYNSGIAAAQGKILLFTDDDVRPPGNWVEGMSAPILQGETDAVAGGIHMAEHLKRAWMKPLHYEWLACTVNTDSAGGRNLIGANMAFSAAVLNKVPEFDIELGPGALGFGDETLFSMQLKQAGYKVLGALDCAVEHHFDPDRLSRKSLLGAAYARGRTEAYVAHHWEHFEIRHARRYLVKLLLTLTRRRLHNYKECRQEEGAPAWELQLLQQIHCTWHYRIERKRRPNYDRFGLTRRGNEVPRATYMETPVRSGQET